MYWLTAASSVAHIDHLARNTIIHRQHVSTDFQRHEYGAIDGSHKDGMTGARALGLSGTGIFVSVSSSDPKLSQRT